MADPVRTTAQARRILLATDLSARSDRALDRAALLATGWDAELIVLHVLEEERPTHEEFAPLPSWRRPPDPLRIAERQLRADLSEYPKKTTILIEGGDPGDVILRTAESRDCDLIVIGVARDELFGRFNPGRTVNKLLRRSGIPVLVVKNRARAPYHDIVVASDFSDSARHALEAATRLFPDLQLTVFHAYEAPMAGLTADPEASRREQRSVAVEEYETFLQNTRLPAGQPLKSLIEWGTPVHLLRDYVDHQNVDLVVLGTHGRSAVSEIFLGSVAKQILADVPRDVMVVGAPRMAAAA